jgi:hypothetical protein
VMAVLHKRNIPFTIVPTALESADGPYQQAIIDAVTDLNRERDPSSPNIHTSLSAATRPLGETDYFYAYNPTGSTPKETKQIETLIEAMLEAETERLRAEQGDLPQDDHSDPSSSESEFEANGNDEESTDERQDAPSQPSGSTLQSETPRREMQSNGHRRANDGNAPLASPPDDDESPESPLNGNEPKKQDTLPSADSTGNEQHPPEDAPRSSEQAQEEDIDERRHSEGFTPECPCPDCDIRDPEDVNQLFDVAISIGTSAVQRGWTFELTNVLAEKISTISAFYGTGTQPQLFPYGSTVHEANLKGAGPDFIVGHVPPQHHDVF